VTNQMMSESYSKAIAASIEADAKEVLVAAALYQRLPSDNLAAGLESLMDRLNETYRVFLRHRAEEAAHAPQK
jgi:hypothetical protein